LESSPKCGGTLNSGEEMMHHHVFEEGLDEESIRLKGIGEVIKESD
jgi:hypothetical protein